MTETEARDWVAGRFPAAAARLEKLVALVTAENDRQNLIAPSTVTSVWARHVVDSLQLVPLAEGAPAGAWLDVGTGGGFPGLAVAAVRDGSMLLVEPRRRRAEFLAHAAAVLGLTGVEVHQARVEAIRARASVISARAVASVAALVEAAVHVASPGTRWLLPRGRVEVADLHAAEQREFVFHVEQSITAAESHIVVLTGPGPAS